MFKKCKKEASKDFKFRRVPVAKCELFNEASLKPQNSYKKCLDSIEEDIKTRIKKTIKIQYHDLTHPLPNKLQRRVHKIVPFQPKTVTKIIEATQSLGGVEDDGISTAEIASDQPPLNECDELLASDALFKHIILNLESAPPPRTEPAAEKCWMPIFVKKKKAERIKWQSKIHRLEKRLTEKPIYFQAEELIDIAATDFSEWINSLSSDSRSNITKELIKELFPIGFEGNAAKAMCIAPEQIMSIPDEVGKIWKLPEMSIEHGIVNINKMNKKEDKKPVKYVAFGRTLPISLRQPPPGIELKDLDPKFPSELKSREVLFKGIYHLRSTKTLVQYLNDNPHIPRPKDLINNDLFKKLGETEDSKHIPLYEYFIKH